MSRTNIQRILAGAVIAAFAAGCAGQSVTPAPSRNAARPAPAQSAPRAHRGRARILIRIPRRSRHARYVSPNTQSMTVSANGTLLATINLTPASPGCTVVDGETQCSKTIGVPVGSIQFAVVTFSGANATGSQLSSGFVTQTIVTGRLAAIPIVLSGIVSSIKVALGNATPNAGTAVSVRVYVTALDASGAAIVGPGSYNVPITLSNSDASGITALSGTTVPAPGTKITLAYTGRSIISATIGASASGVLGTNVTTATFAPTPRVFKSFNTPSSSINANTGMLAIATGADHNVWVTVSGGPGNNGIVAFSADGTVPAAYTHAQDPALSDDTYDGIAEDANGNVWFTENTGDKIGEITFTGHVINEYSTTGGGAFCPNKIIAGKSGADLWVTSSCSDSIGHFLASNPSGFTQATLTGGGTNYQGLLLSKDGFLYVVDRGNPAIGRVDVSAFPTVVYTERTVPVNPLDSSANGALYGIAQTADGQLWFTNYTCTPNTLGSIVPQSNFASSPLAEFTTIQGCSNPAGMVVTPDGSRLFLALANYPAIEEVVPNAPGAAPTLTDFAVNVQTPNDVFQQTNNMVIGPNGNLWASAASSGSISPTNVLEIAY